MKSSRILTVLILSIPIILLFKNCASVSKSLGGVWYDPSLAISQPPNDQRGSNLMTKNRAQIISFLSASREDKSLPAGWILTNKLREGGTRYRNLMGGIYLTIGIDRGIEYNADQVAGLVDSPRKRAEKDFEDCAVFLLKKVPRNLLENEDVNGISFSMKHKVKERTKQFGAPYDETAEIIFQESDVRSFQNMEIGTSNLLSKAVFIVNGTRL